MNNKKVIVVALIATLLGGVMGGVFAQHQRAVEINELKGELEEAAATGYIDAVDDIMEGAYYLLRTLGPLDVTLWTTKKDHQVAGKLYAGN